MEASQHLAVRAAVVALLKAAPALAAGRVYANRDFSLAADVASQAHVNFVSSEPLESEIAPNAPRDWSSEFEIKVLARRTQGVEAGDVADAVWAAAYARVMVDPSLGGLCWDLQPADVSVDHDEADTSLCRLTWRFVAKHRTQFATITA